METRTKQPRIRGIRKQRHIFGARDSPACANFFLQQTAKDDIEDHPNSLEIIQWTFYMDDMAASFSEVIIAFTTAKGVEDTLKKVNSARQKVAATAQSFVSRCKTINANHSKVSAVNFFMKVYLKFTGTWTKTK